VLVTKTLLPIKLGILIELRLCFKLAHEDIFANSPPSHRMRLTNGASQSALIAEFCCGMARHQLPPAFSFRSHFG
jgi:hypothetical protein